MGEIEAVQASYKNFAEVKCPMGRTRAKRALGSSNVTVPLQLAVSVANTKTSAGSDIIIYTQFDSRCQSCDFSTGEWTVKVGREYAKLARGHDSVRLLDSNHDI